MNNLLEFATYGYDKLISICSRSELHWTYLILRFETFKNPSSRDKVDISVEMDVMYLSLFDAVFADSFLSYIRKAYVVYDSELEEIERKKEKKNLRKLRLLARELEEPCQARA